MKSSDFQKMDKREFCRKIDRVKVPTRSASPLFSRFGFLGLLLLLVPNMKKWLAERRFYSKEEMIAETNAYFAELNQFYYSEGINWSSVGRSV